MKKFLKFLLFTASACALSAFVGCSDLKDEINQRTCKHVYKESAIVTEATCTVEGKALFICEKCDKEKTEKTELAEHKEQIVLERSPTCTEMGVVVYDCMECGFVRQALTPAFGHAAEVVEGYAATCTEDGLTDGSKCSTCNTVFIAQEAIPATGHSKIYEPSATGDGTHTSSCEACGLSFEAEEHTIGEWVSEGEVGVDSRDVLYCAYCDEVLDLLDTANVDENGNEIVLDVDLNITSLDEESTATFSLQDVLSSSITKQTIAGFSGLFYNGELIYVQEEIMANFAAMPATIFDNNLGLQALVLGLLLKDGSEHQVVLKINVVNNAKVEVAVVDGECVAGNWYRIYNATSTSSDDWVGGFVISDGENQLFLFIELLDGSSTEGNAYSSRLDGASFRTALNETLYVVGDGYTDVYLPAGTVLLGFVPTGADTRDTVEITIDENTVMDLSVEGPSSQEVVIKRLVPALDV